MSPDAAPAARRPRFSLVTAVYNVHRYLDAFIASIDAQDHGLGDVEVIVVDDGSTDDSLVGLKQWAQRCPDLVTVLTQDNAGQGAARNRGLAHATGEWVSFPDPDDILEPDYLSRVAAFLDANPATAMVATARIFLNDRTGQIVDSHPLKAMFAQDRLVDLDRAPEFFHGSAPAAFLRRDVIEQAGLEFDVRIRPNFEDGHFCARYLLSAGSVLVGFVGSARYLYRKRADGSSTLDTGLLKPSRFTDVPRYGYLDLLERSTPAAGGYPPEWLQNFVLYELSYYFSSDRTPSGDTAAHGAVAEEFLRVLRLIVPHLDPQVIDRFAVRPLDPAWRDILQHGLADESWVAPYAVLERADPGSGLVRLSYRFTGPAPRESLGRDGEPVPVVHGKVFVHEYFDHDLLHERVAWVPAGGPIEVQLDGRPVVVRDDWPGPTAPPVRRALRWPTRVVRRLAGLWLVRRLFRGAWVLMDRISEAGDSGERLFAYLRAERRDVNAWFVVRSGTPDHQRLRREHGRRVVAHGGVVWRMLMLNCVHLASSQAEAPVHRPPEIVRMREPAWRFSYLPPGVVTGDESRWLNPKRLDLFVTSTPAEQASVAGDYTTYAYTSKEARMTGAPRLDRLRELGSRVPVEQRDLLLVCPAGPRRALPGDVVDTGHGQPWTAFLTDERLAAVCTERGLRIGFLAPPDLRTSMELPAHVEVLGDAGQEVLARAAMVVTDHSSTAFDAAYLDRPVVYLQLDAEQVGYFDHARDGFGPVTRTAAQAVDEVVAVIEAGCRPAVDYQARIDATFPERDGRCCERTTAAIEDMLPPPSGQRRGVR